MADGDALKFRVDLVGNMVSELVSSGRAANTAEGNVQALTAAIIDMTEASKKKESSFFTFDLAKGAEMAWHVVERLVESVADLGKEIISAAAGAQDLDVALKLTAGPDHVADIEAIGKSFGDTRFGAHGMEQKLLPLLERGLGKDNPALLQNVATAATDVAARQNNVAAVDEVISAFERVHTRREVSARMLTSLGVNEKDFYADLGETLGRSAKQAEALVKAGKVQAETLEAELLGEIAKREGGKLGVATDASAKTLETTLARLERLPHTLFMQLADSPGLALLQERVDHFVTELSGPAGGRIVTALGGAFVSLSQFLLGDEHSAESFVAALTTGIPQVIEAFKLMVDAAKLLVPVLEGIVGAMQTAAGIYYSISGNKPPEEETDIKYGPTYWMENINNQETYDLAQKYGELITKGVQDGVLKGNVGVEEAVAQLTKLGRIAPEQYESSDPALSSMPTAHDFIWRDGHAIQIDPADNVVGFKRGGSMGIGGGASLSDLMGGSSGRGGSAVFTYAPHLTLGAGVTAEQTHEADRIMRFGFLAVVDEARARLGVR